MDLSGLTEGLIRQCVSAESFQRGREYFRDGAVVSLARRGDVLQGEVEGSQPSPYRTRVVVDAGGIADAECDCPYDWGGWCKHIVATLLASIDCPEAVDERPSVEALLEDLDREQLRALMLGLAERDPSLADAIEGEIALLRARPTDTTAAGVAQPQPRQTAVDPSAFRRQVRASLHSLDRMRRSEAYWHVGGVVGEVSGVLGQARAFVEAGDGKNALVVLEAITEEYVDGWVELDDSNGEGSGFFEELGPVWTEALLTAELTPAERRAWVEKLDRWARDVADYGVETAFDAARAAAEQGWDYPPLQRVLQGQITERGAWEDEAPDYADELADARLNVLERQGRHQEFLHLAEAESQTERYTTMLARLGRTAEAVEYGLEYLGTTHDALALATTLRERGELEAALRIAEHGLSLGEPKATLATWLCDLAAAMGQTERALRAATLAFRESPTLSTYLRAQELAGERWPEHRDELLGHLRRMKSYYPQGQVEVFLHEGLVDDAIAAVEGGATHTIVAQVVDAAIHSRPDWAIRTCRQQADSIMDEGKAQYYGAAIEWLAKAREAYRAAGREAEWRAQLDELIARHQRKYKLRPMLESLKSGS